LDRFIDEELKFLFETYNVDGSSHSIKKAIKKNGLVTVKFFKEALFNNITTVSNPWNGWTTWTNTGTANWPQYKTTTDLPPSFHNTTTSKAVFASSTGVNITNTGSNITTSGNVGSLTFDNGWNISSAPAGTLNITNHGNPVISLSATTTRDAQLKTGRVKKGTKSKQKLLMDVNYVFESNYSYETSLQILPEESRSTYDSSEIRNYCPECGRKVKAGWKFCPSCGDTV